MDLAYEMNYFYAKAAVGELQALNGDAQFMGMSYHSLLYLNIIQMTDGCTAGKLAKLLGITPAAATLKINELQRQGAVVRQRSPRDGRVSLLSLSPETEKACRQYDRCFRRTQRALEGRYSPQELELFGRILRDISDSDWSIETP